MNRECKISGKGEKKQIKRPKKWKPSYFNLIGGSFHIYKDVEVRKIKTKPMYHPYYYFELVGMFNLV